MKKILSMISLLACTLSCAHKGHLETISVSYLHDNSDENRIIPDAHSILRLYEYNTQKLCYGGNFHQGYINDFMTHQEIDIDIPNQKEGEKENVTDDGNFRKKEVINFREQVFNAIQKNTVQPFQERPQSHVYESICTELHRLKKENAYKKILIISSDLCENTDKLNCYKQSFIRIIEADKEKAKSAITKKLEDTCELPDNLESITIYILFEPKTKEEDIRFSFFKEIYRELLEKRGAKVYIKSINEIKEY